jgi:hypothetical protein
MGFIRNILRPLVLLALLGVLFASSCCVYKLWDDDEYEPSYLDENLPDETD